MRLYFQLYLNKKELESEEILFFLKECVLSDLQQHTITRQVSNLVNGNSSGVRMLIKSDEYFEYLKGGKSWNCSLGCIVT